MRSITWLAGVLFVLGCTAATVATLGIALIVIVPVLVVAWALFLQLGREGGLRRRTAAARRPDEWSTGLGNEAPASGVVADPVGYSTPAGVATGGTGP